MEVNTAPRIRKSWNRPFSATARNPGNTAIPPSAADHDARRPAPGEPDRVPRQLARDRRPPAHLRLPGEHHDPEAPVPASTRTRTADIHMYINGPGGSVSATLAASYDTMQFLECPIATYCMGIAASGARSCWPPARRASGRPAELEGDDPPALRAGRRPGVGHRDPAQEILKERERLNEILAKHTNQPLEAIDARPTATATICRPGSEGVRPRRRGALEAGEVKKPGGELRRATGVVQAGRGPPRVPDKVRPSSWRVPRRSPAPAPEHPSAPDPCS